PDDEPLADTDSSGEPSVSDRHRYGALKDQYLERKCIVKIEPDDGGEREKHPSLNLSGRAMTGIPVVRAMLDDDDRPDGGEEARILYERVTSCLAAVGDCNRAEREKSGSNHAAPWCAADPAEDVDERDSQRACDDRGQAQKKLRLPKHHDEFYQQVIKGR